MNVDWQQYFLKPTFVIDADNRFDWTIRIVGNVEERIRTRSAESPKVETGGLLIGHTCLLSKTVYITDAPDPPSAARKTPTRFEIATDGLGDLFNHIHRQTQGQITFIGTWHSHTSATPPSGLDKQTLKTLQSNYDLPVVMLVHTGGTLERVLC